ncbi:uncharacterized protein PRCAT00003597001 [Priceomyces carsonii]|uniref:uncharacterized protein n=1 Tax=Priceomyces carsonii TaxID=28549 RepID=UPI002ED78140|nr:unnamed protein product [Priceomyces carsonii]
MVPKKFLLQLIQNSLTELGYQDLAIQLEHELNSEKEFNDPTNDVELSKSKYVNWFKSELKTGNYSTILAQLMSSLNNLENEMAVDSDDIQFSNASDVNFLELLNDNQNSKKVLLVVTYFIKRTFLLECIVLMSQPVDNINGDIGKSSIVQGTGLIEYLRDELMPILDSIENEEGELYELNNIFDYEVLKNLSREKETNLFLPFLLQLPLTKEHLVTAFNHIVLSNSTIATDSSLSFLICSLRDLLLNKCLYKVFKSGIQTHALSHSSLPVNCLEKLIEQAKLYQDLQSPFYLSPRSKADTFIDMSIPFSREQHEANKKAFPIHLCHTLSEHVNEVWFAKFSPLGLFLASGSLDGRVIIYDVLDSFKVLHILESNAMLDNQAFTPFSKKTSSNASKAVIYCCWDPEERYLVSCHLDTVVRVWYLGDLCLKNTPTQEASPEDPVKLVSCFTLGQNIRTWTCEFLPKTIASKQIFIVGSLDKVLKAFDVDGVEVFDFFGTSDDNTYINDEMKGDDEKHNNMSEEENDTQDKTKTDDPELSKKKIQTTFNRVNDLGITPDGKILITANNDKRVNFYRVPDLLDEQSITTKLATLNLNGRLTSCSISSNNRFLLVNVVPEELQVWDISKLYDDTGGPTLYKKYFGHSQSANIVRSTFGYLANGEEELVLSGSDDGFIYLWKTNTGQLITRVKGHNGLCNSVDWNNGYQIRDNNKDYGKLWCSVGDDKTVKIWGPPDWNG